MLLDCRTQEVRSKAASKHFSSYKRGIFLTLSNFCVYKIGQIKALLQHQQQQKQHQQQHKKQQQKQEK